MSEQDRHDGRIDERLADWVDDRLLPDERAEFEAWLAEDPSRQAEADEYRRTVDAVRGALRHGPHAPRDFASRVVEAAASSEPVAHDAARARRFAWVGSAAAAAVFVLVFFVVQRLNRAGPNAEDLASAPAPEAAGGVPSALGFDGFVEGALDEERAAQNRFAVVAEAPEALELEKFLGGGGETLAPAAGGGGGRSGGLGLGGGAGPASPASPGPIGPGGSGATAGPGAPAARVARRDADGVVSGSSELFFRGRSVADARPIGALVYVIHWPSAEPRKPSQAKSEGDAAAPAPTPIEPARWLRSSLATGPQDNVIVLPEDLVPLDLGPARLALGESPVADTELSPGEYWPSDGDAAFLVRGDASQRDRMLRILLRAAREQGAELSLARSRFRRLDLREEEGESREPAGSDVALVLRGVIPAPPPASGKQK